MSRLTDFTNKNTEFSGTDGITVPVGTSAQRSGTDVGKVRYNTDLGFYFYVSFYHNI